MNGTRKLGIAVVLGAVAALVLIAVGVTRHPTSIQGVGKSLLITDVALLLTYGAASLWVWQQDNSVKAADALSTATAIGLALGIVLVVNHLVEIFVTNRPFVIVIAPVLLALALFGAAGSVVWERTRSFAMSVISGLWCGVVAMLVLICCVLSFNWVFEPLAVRGLHDAFMASALSDPGAFVVVNSLEAASEGLVRMPVLGLFLSLLGAVVKAWFAGRTRKTALALAGVIPVLLALGVTALWRADKLERAARPPFVIFGVLLSGIALCSVHPAWSALRRAHR